MNQEVKNATAAVLAPRLFSGFKFRWIAWGIATYYGLKFLNKRGIFPKQTDAALGLIDQGINTVKSQVGLSTSPHEEAPALKH